MTRFCGNCGQEQLPQVSTSPAGMRRTYVFQEWWQSPEISCQIATYAVCACGVHTNVKGQILICPKCKELGIRETADGAPGEFQLMALYRPINGRET
jgi:hypothetical protein